MEIIEKAKEIAWRDLRACYHGQGILASPVNFSDFWCRDTFWACIGLLEAEIDLEKVKSSLELFLSYQREDGKIPRKICLDYNGLKYLGLKIQRSEPRPIYSSAIKLYFSVDDNLLLVIAFCLYVQKTQDYDFGKKHFSQVKQALNFYKEKNLLIDHLIFEVGLGNWMDTIFKRGFVLYTNTLWYKALKELEKLTDELKKSGYATEKKIDLSSNDIFQAIQEKFWLAEKGYFADNVHVNGMKIDYFDLAGNVQAVLFDLADKNQSDQILHFVEKIKSQPTDATLHPINYPLYPGWKISPMTYLFGIRAYQNGNSWSWIEQLLAAAQAKSGRRQAAEQTLKNFSEIIVRNGYVHENYNLDGAPFNHLLWKSAFPFAWGAGIFLFAYHRLKNSSLDQRI